MRFEVVTSRSVTPPTPGAGWPMFHADVFHEGRIVTSWPALAGDTAYVGLRDESGVAHNGVLAVGQSDGERRWFSPTDAMVQGSPAVAGGIVYAPDIRGTLYAMEAATGRELWRERFVVDPSSGCVGPSSPTGATPPWPSPTDGCSSAFAPACW